MKAWLLDDYSGIEGLRLAEVPDPSPQPGEVVLAVRYAGLNPADRYLAQRQYPAQPVLPHILGRDGLGTVVQIGSNVTGVGLGNDEPSSAAISVEAGLALSAERVAVPGEGLIEIPSGWSEEEAAGAALVYLTAYQALTVWGPLPEKAVVLVTGASGGVGVACVQLARAFGHTIVALSRSPGKSARLRELGAQFTFDPEDTRWRQAAKAALAPRRVDLAVDNIGGRLLPEVIDTLGDLGRVSLVGRLAGPVPEFNTATLFFRRIRLGGIAVGAYKADEGKTAWQRVVSLLARTGARPLVDSVWPFQQIQQAFSRLAAGPMGKVLLRVQ